MPKMARGTSGSSTRTMSRNIMVLKAMEVSRIITRSPRIVGISKMEPTPASRAPMAVMITPVSTALMAPAAFSPNTNSVFVMGVTK
jgi:hypothetical protein